MEYLRIDKSILDRELKDVNISTNHDFEIELNAFTSIVGFVFDGILVDAWIQFKINKSKSAFSDLISAVTVIKSKLTKQINQYKNKLLKIDRPIYDLLN